MSDVVVDLRAVAGDCALRQRLIQPCAPEQPMAIQCRHQAGSDSTDLGEQQGEACSRGRRASRRYSSAGGSSRSGGEMPTRGSPHRESRVSPPRTGSPEFPIGKGPGQRPDGRAQRGASVWPGRRVLPLYATRRIGKASRRRRSVRCRDRDSGRLLLRSPRFPARTCRHGGLPRSLCAATGRPRGSTSRTWWAVGPPRSAVRPPPGCRPSTRGGAHDARIPPSPSRGRRLRDVVAVRDRMRSPPPPIPQTRFLRRSPTPREPDPPPRSTATSRWCPGAWPPTNRRRATVRSGTGESWRCT